MTDYMKQEYSDKFDELRRNRVEVSYHKYGPAKKNFQSGNVQALPTMERCVEKYNSTGNTEYLLDAANYLMFDFIGRFVCIIALLLVLVAVVSWER